MRDVALHDRRYRDGNITAAAVAGWLKIEGANRLGNGAVKGSYSGRMSGALRASPRLNSLTRRGLLHRFYDTGRTRHCYGLTDTGWQLLEQEVT